MQDRAQCDAITSRYDVKMQSLISGLMKEAEKPIKEQLRKMWAMHSFHSRRKSQKLVRNKGRLGRSSKEY